MVARSIARIIVATVVSFSALPAHAVRPDEILADPKLEARARALSAELRCMVCQNQSIDDSEAPLARDLRGLLRDRLKAGDSDAQVKSYLVARYGDFVLLKPPLRWDTVFLWLAPLGALAVGAVAIARAARRRSKQPDAAPLSEAETAELTAVLERERG
jgi:cytochrome c-type biogenesis protein CcmH